MNFTDTLDNSPTDLIGSKYGVVVFAAEDFDDWCESLAIAHDDEVYIASNAYLEDIPDERLTKNGLVRLPVDADGVPIHVGDVVTMQLLFGGESKPLVVDRMELSHGRDGDLWCVALDTDKECWNQPSLMRHYTPPTVEDVLREFSCVLMGKREFDGDVTEAVAEYAAKLTLRGDE